MVENGQYDAMLYPYLPIVAIVSGGHQFIGGQCSQFVWILMMGWLGWMIIKHLSLDHGANMVVPGVDHEGAIMMQLHPAVL